MSTPRIGVFLPTMSATGAAVADVTAAARHAEQLGFESVWAVDQLIAGTGAPFIDSTVTLAAAAGATSRIRLAYGVMVLPLRPVVWAAGSPTPAGSVACNQRASVRRKLRASPSRRCSGRTSLRLPGPAPVRHDGARSGRLPSVWWPSGSRSRSSTGHRPQRAWREAYGDAVVAAAHTEGLSDLSWHEFGWGVVLEVELPDEFAWDRLLAAPAVRAALDAVPDPVGGLLVHRGRGGSAGVRWPRRPRPLAGAGAVALPEPVESEMLVFDAPQPTLL